MSAGSPREPPQAMGALTDNGQRTGGHGPRGCHPQVPSEAQTSPHHPWAKPTPAQKRFLSFFERSLCFGPLGQFRTEARPLPVPGTRQHSLLGAQGWSSVPSRAGEVPIPSSPPEQPDEPPWSRRAPPWGPAGGRCLWPPSGDWPPSEVSGWGLGDPQAAAHDVKLWYGLNSLLPQGRHWTIPWLHLHRGHPQSPSWVSNLLPQQNGRAC